MTVAALVLALRAVLSIVCVIVGSAALSCVLIAIVAACLALSVGARARTLEPDIIRGVVSLALIGVGAVVLAVWLAPPGWTL